MAASDWEVNETPVIRRVIDVAVGRGGFATVTLPGVHVQIPRSRAQSMNMTADVATQIPQITPYQNAFERGR